VAFSSNGATLAVGGCKGSNYLWDLATHKVSAVLRDPDGQSIYTVALSTDGQFLAASNYTGTTYLWNVRTHALTANLNTITTTGTSALAFSPDGKTLAVADDNGYTYLWDTATGNQVIIPNLAFGDANHISALAYSPDGKTLAGVSSYYYGSGSYLWNTASYTVISRIDGYDFVAFSRDGKTIAVGDGGGNVRLWSLTTHRLIAVFNDPNYQNSGADAWAFDGPTLAIGDYNGFTYVWNVATRKLVATLHNEGSPLAVSPDGKLIVTGGGQSSTYLWDVRSHF